MVKYKKYQSLIEKYKRAKKEIYDHHNKLATENSAAQADSGIDDNDINLLNHLNQLNKLNELNNNTKSPEISSDGEDEKMNLRSILGQELPYGQYPAGEYSYPGPDITFTPPPSNPLVTCLGCLGNVGGSSNTSVIWPHLQIPSNLATGSSQVNAAIRNGDLSLSPVNWLPFYLRDLQTPSGDNSGFTFQNIDYATTDTNTSIGQPFPQTIPINIRDTLPIVETGDGNTRFTQNYADVTNMIGPDNNGKLTNTPFMSSVTLNTDSSILSVSAIASNYAVANLSQEGILWTLWPIAKPNKKTPSMPKTTYFNGLNFGTAPSSNYRIGQLGYFYNNRNLGCIPMGANLSSFSIQTGILNPGTFGQFGINSVISPDINYTEQQINPGVQGFYRTLLISTMQVIAIVVVKVSEEIARVINPASGEMGEERFIYLGYDGWAVIRTTANPVGPMMAQTYITPQTVTGSVTKENYQVVFPPNFYNEVFYKNGDRSVPVDTRTGLSYPAFLKPFDSTGNDDGFISLYDTIQNIIKVNNITDPNILAEIYDIRFNPTALSNVFSEIAYTRDYETTLGEGTIKFTLYRDGTNEELITKVMNSTSNPVLNFNTGHPKPRYIDGKIQLYPRFAESLRPYVEIILQSKNNNRSNENSESSESNESSESSENSETTRVTDEAERNVDIEAEVSVGINQVNETDETHERTENNETSASGEENTQTLQIDTSSPSDGIDIGRELRLDPTTDPLDNSNEALFLNTTSTPVSPATPISPTSLRWQF